MTTLTLSFLFLLLAIALLAYAELSIPTELTNMNFTIQPNPAFSGAFLLTKPESKGVLTGATYPSFSIPCANNATAQTLLRDLTQPAPQAVDEPPVNLNRQTATITNGPIGNFTVTIYNSDGTVDDSYDCQNYATAQYLTRNFR